MSDQSNSTGSKKLHRVAKVLHDHAVAARKKGQRNKADTLQRLSNDVFIQAELAQ